MKTPCHDMQDRILEMISNLLSPQDTSAVIEHLNVCEGCREYYFALYQEHLALAAMASSMEETRRKSVDQAMSLLPEQTEYSFWRKIMTRKIMSLAAAAVVVFVIGLILVLATRTTPEAYALQQTIDAIKKADIIHILGRDWQERKVEMWIKMNSQNMNIEACRIDEPEKSKLTVCTPEATYIYDKKKNQVEIPIGTGAYTYFSMSSFFEYMQKMTKDLKGTMTSEYVYSPDFGRSVILVDIKTDYFEIQCVVDKETKLPLRVLTLKGPQRGGEFELLRNSDTITYDEVPPAGTFEFQLPLEAKVIDQRKISTTPPSRILSPAVIGWVLKFHADALKNAGITKPMFTNTHVYIVDGKLNLTNSGVLVAANETQTPLSGEMVLSGFTYSNVEVYDAGGIKQKTRLVKTLFRENHYRLHLTPRPPLAPGEVRQYLWAIGQARTLNNANPEKLYYVNMQNLLGCEGLESFLLVVPKEITVQMKTENYLKCERVEDVDIYVWQKHVNGSDNHETKVGLNAENLVR